MKNTSKSKKETIIALAGNPNVGKSTVFNELTGLKQHTGNWAGKTVENAKGIYKYRKEEYTIVDLPGTYSLMAHSSEEEEARNYICFGNADAIIVICDSTCLERNLNIVLQTMEICRNVVVCTNFMDEAKNKKIAINFNTLESLLHTPVVGITARKHDGLETMMEKTINLINNKEQIKFYKIDYGYEIEKAIELLEPTVKKYTLENLNSRWVCLKLLEKDEKLIRHISSYLKCNIYNDELNKKLDTAFEYLSSEAISNEKIKEIIVSKIVAKAEDITKTAIKAETNEYNQRDRNIDKILTGKYTGIPIMLLLLMLIFWITITGANYPSQLLANILFSFSDTISAFFSFLGLPIWLNNMLVQGVYKVLAWVVSVMLPPMAIFFPLFTMLEDLGYLPRIAFNMDNCFKKACACGKQSLTLCMGFGCNAVGVIGARIIDSPRERLVAILTNNFVPCNGRFPTLIAIISMFFVGSTIGLFQTISSAFILTTLILLGIVMTFVVSKLLSKTILKGLPSSFTLELPPYRKPQLIRILIRSIFDRTLFVLGRAVVVAAPAGLIIWILANVTVADGGTTPLQLCSDFLDPYGKAIGLDGIILLAFILGFPANEIVFPIIIMAYLSETSLLEMDNLYSLKTLLLDNGWTWVTALCTMIFSLMHWPCSTTCLTIQKETKEFKWTALSFIIPTVIGIVICFTINTIAHLFFTL